jgi:hypothetical protein
MGVVSSSWVGCTPNIIPILRVGRKNQVFFQFVLCFPIVVFSIFFQKKNKVRSRDRPLVFSDAIAGRTATPMGHHPASLQQGTPQGDRDIAAR